MERLEICSDKLCMARSFLATTISPEVSLSKRCTIPALGNFFNSGYSCNKAFNNVPDLLPAPGCTTIP